MQKHCKSCDPCQRVRKGQDKGKAVLIPIPIIEEPFQRVVEDLGAPLSKVTQMEKKYILIVAVYTTRYPEAVALSSIKADKND